MFDPSRMLYDSIWHIVRVINATVNKGQVSTGILFNGMKVACYLDIYSFYFFREGRHVCTHT